MPPPTVLNLESILRSCADATPQPWRPATYAKAAGIDRDSLDDPLNRLRIAGLVKLTDWEPGIGQGYVLTDVGRSALSDSDVLKERLNTKPDTPFNPKNKEPNADRFERGERVRAAVFDYHPGQITRILIAAQVVVFGIGLYFALRAKVPLEQYITSGQSPVTRYMAVSPPHLARGEWWTLISYALVHAGALHLLLNLMSHGALGPAMEGMFGSWRFLVIWLISAIGGGVVVAARGQAAVGSSGAICGLIGAQAAFVAIYHPHIGRRATAQFRTWLIKTTIIIVVLSSIPWVSGAAHLGGAIAGALAGACLAVHRFGPTSLRPLMIVGTVAIPALGLVYLDGRGILNLAITEPQVVQHERGHFNLSIRPQIEREELNAHTVEEEHIDPLRALQPEQRPNDNIRSAIKVLGDLQTEQVRALATVLQTGRYHTENIERARHAAEELLKIRAEVSRQFEQCLRRGSDWTVEKNEHYLQMLLNQALEAEIAYRRAVGEV